VTTGSFDADLLIAGGGPVGLVAALYAAGAGLSVILCDPRAPSLDSVASADSVDSVDKACGEGLMPAAVEALADLEVDPAGHELIGIRYLSGDRYATGRFRDGPGRGVQRTALHDALLRRVRAVGMDVRREAVASVDQDDDGVTVQCVRPGGRPGSRLRARYLLAADGLHSPLRRELGLDRGTVGARRYGLRQHVAVPSWTDCVEVYWSRCSEAYVTPVGPDCVNVAVLSSERASLTTQLEAFPVLLRRLRGADRAHRGVDRVLGAGPLRQRSRRRVSGRVLLVGDASGYVDALTGEGISLGIAQARKAVAAVTADRPQRYETDWRRVTWRPSGLTHTLLLASRVPPLRRAIVPAAVAAPRLFAAVVNAAARPGG